MSKGLIRSQERGAALEQKITKMTLSLDGLAMAITEDTAIGWGTVVVGGLPEANILLLGLVMDATLTASGTGIEADFAGSVALGTVATADDDITTPATNDDMLTSTAYSAADTSVATFKVDNATSVIIDNTDGTAEINLNVIIDDAGVAGDVGVLTAAGALYIVYVTLGDD